jgi:hypothetical protein
MRKMGVNADATLRTRNSAPPLIESRSSNIVTAPSAMRLSIRRRSTIAHFSFA